MSRPTSRRSARKTRAGRRTTGRRSSSRARPSRKTARRKTATTRRSSGGRRTTRKKQAARGGAARRRPAAPESPLTLGAWRIPVELLERLNAAAYWHRRSAASLVRDALEDHIGKLERRHGSRFPSPR